MDTLNTKTSTVVSWIWIVAMVLIIWGKGLFAFYIISDKGMPTWDYRTIEDVPALSPYAVYEKLPYAQHIRGREGE